MAETTVHVPIMVEPILEGLMEPFRGLPENAAPMWLVDCTLGGGGHTDSFLKAFAGDPRLRKHRVLSVDRDLEAIDRAKRRFAAELAEGRLEIMHSRFGELDLSGRKVLGLMADLGFSSDQVDSTERGFSFRSDGPLDMRMDTSRGLSAREYLAQVGEEELARVLFEYGEERFSRRIARAVLDSRRMGTLPTTTRGLADLIVQAVPPAGRHGRIHAATRSFQALRIVVNEELEELDSLLDRVILSLETGGRAAILSFHSLEDRRVKQVFKARDGQFKQLTKKVIEADEAELARNPRSRSAKLRIAEKIR